MFTEENTCFDTNSKFYEMYALKDDDGNIHENDMDAIERMSFLTIADKKYKPKR